MITSLFSPSAEGSNSDRFNYKSNFDNDHVDISGMPSVPGTQAAIQPETVAQNFDFGLNL